MTAVMPQSADENRTTHGFDPWRVRRDFPILTRKVHGKDLVYLDNAASAQRPNQVLAAVEDCYHRYYSNVHRGVHTLSQESTTAYEGARVKAQGLLNAESAREIVFVRGTTEGINLVAQAWGRSTLGAGDEVVLTMMEHHSNIVPWQLLAEQTGVQLRVAPVTPSGELDLEGLGALLNERTKLVAVVHVSNTLGTVNPIAQIADMAHAVGALVLVDGAQAVPHQRVDVQALGCDFYCFSGHKAFGPTGIGVLYGREAILDAMPPWQGGGEMISRVTFDGTTFAELPAKFEAGTPNIAGAIGLGAAIDYLQEIGYERIGAHEARLLEAATEKLLPIPGLRIYGEAPGKASVISFLVDGVHAHDLGTILDDEGVAVRAGHHCTQPLMQFYGVPSTVRASFAFYNTEQEIDRLVAGVERARELFRL